jgi:hypothetical protein
MRVTALILILGAAAWRILAVHSPELSNFAPLMALAFCGGVYFRSWRMWLIPFVALGLSDLYLDHYYSVQYHYEFPFAEWSIRLLCFAAGLGLGRLATRHRSWLNLLTGILEASLLFYLVTNTAAWRADPGYARTLAGWWQAMTVGHPQFAPTILFYRNTFASDLLFTGAFVLAMEYAALRRGDRSLLKSSAV